jgi:hypothetical protein
MLQTPRGRIKIADAYQRTDMALAGEKLNRLLLKISATTIVNQAIIKCSMIGIPVSIDNAIMFIGDFFDPEDGDFAELISEIEHILEVTLAPSRPQRAS